MRKTFLDILQDKSNVDYKREYRRLRKLFYEKEVGINSYTMYSYINEKFLKLNHRKNAISLTDFEEDNNFTFKEQRSIESLDEMLLFCEYVSNFCEQISCGIDFKVQELLDLIKKQISTFIDSIGYEKITKDNVILYIPKEPASIEVAEFINDEDVSYKILCYNHHSLKGDLEGKRQILEKLAHKLEPNEKELEKINLSLKKHLFGAFNNLNIRHNNLEAKDGDYNKKFAQLTDEKKEEMYDSLYKDCLIAFLELENNSKRCEIKDYYKK
ncbi:MAG: hypothetical protein J6X43_04915 [Bacteroidales bacterium]|nr:hypothetical protein [Bacteroidales bacterium]